MEVTQEEVLKALQTVVEPDLRKDIVSLDLVEGLMINGLTVSFTVKVHNPAMHARKRMEEACHFALERALGKGLNVKVNISPLGNERREDQRSVLPGVKHVIAVASGKGGVGKSTVTANLAAGLAKKGYKVGLIDADIYGPSMPTMFGCVEEKPVTIEKNGKSFIGPVEAHGVKLLSIGFFADPEEAVVWRGPMASKALTQMFTDAWWGDLDFMIVDLPPGTGDIHLTLVSDMPLTDVVVVSTPQEVALADARKAIAMFGLPSINIPILGVVENMAWFTPAELPDNKYYIFGQDGAKNLAVTQGLACLAQVPLVQSVREAGDVGRPAVLQEGTIVSQAFEGMTEKVLNALQVSAGV